MVTKKQYIYYHTCLFGYGWTDILEKQLLAIKASKILEEENPDTQLVFNFVSHEDPREDPFESRRLVEFIASSLGNGASDARILVDVADPVEREKSTLSQLWLHAQREPKADFLYIHSKGLSYQTDFRVRKCVDDWREFMVYHLIERWKNAVTQLKSADAVGVNLTTTETTGMGEVPIHFSGNYWWAKGEYLSNLSNPLDFPGLDVRESEFWIGTGGGKLVSLAQSGVNHYRELYPRSNYGIA